MRWIFDVKLLLILTNGKKWNIINKVTSKFKTIFIIVESTRKEKRKMKRTRSLSNKERFELEMMERPFPFNQPVAIASQALCFGSCNGLTEAERYEIARKYLSK